MNERANVVAIVVTFKRKEFLCKILDSLIRQTFPINKIIVIDNNSLDGTKELVEDFCRINTEVNRKIRYYDTGENLGGQEGLNVVLKLLEILIIRISGLWMTICYRKIIVLKFYSNVISRA